MSDHEKSIYIPQEDFEKLAEIQHFYCISIYLPIQKQQQGLHGKEALTKHIERLKELLSKNNIEGYLATNYIKPIQQLIQEDEIWETGEKSLAIFANENNTWYFKIPVTVKNHLYLTSNFHLLPLFKRATKSQIQKDSKKVKAILLNEEQVSNKIEKIIPMAFEGEIDTLYIPESNGMYGVYDYDNKTTMIDKVRKTTNMSLYNLAAIQTYLKGGTVYLTSPDKMPVQGISLHAIIK